MNFDKWVAPDGLVYLIKDSVPGAPYRLGLPCTARDSENGVLWLAMLMLWLNLRGEFKEEHKSHIKRTLAFLEDEEYPGIFHRHPANKARSEAHDNYVGIMALSVLVDGPWAGRVCEFGENNGWSFPNVTPQDWVFKQLRQPGEIAFYAICADKVPYLIEFAHLCIGLLISAAFSKASAYNLSFVRCHTLAKKLSDQPNWVRGGLGLSLLLWSLISYLRKRSTTWGFTAYFDETHPIRRLAEWTHSSRV